MNDIPRIHIRDEVTFGINSIMLPQVDLRIPLRLSGIFSYFESRYLTDTDIEKCENMDTPLFTPYSKVGDPHCTSYDEQEENFLDFRG